MWYSKKPLTFEQQAELLVARGLETDVESLVARLRTVNYYRLSGYLHPFRNPDDTFRSGTTLQTVWRRYVFDRRLRLLVLDAIERVEVAVRTQLIYELSHETGAFGYTDAANLPKLTGDRFAHFLKRVEDETQRSHEQFVKHFHQKYGDQHEHLPLWMAAEIMPFGVLLTLFTGVKPQIKRRIASQYRIADTVLHSWMGSINVVRNICAHHGRLWNRELGFKPLIPHPRKHPEWHTPVPVASNRVFAILTILRYMLWFVAPQSGWPARVHMLLAEYPDIPRAPMGFPADWETCPIWSRNEEA